MIYRLKELQGDTIAVPQLVFSKVGIGEEYNVRVELYVLATGITDPDKLCADLKLRSRMTAESALSFWAGAGLLERYEENAAPGEEPSAPAPMTWQEIAAASRTDPMISSLIDCAQTGFARPLTHSEMEKIVHLYLQDGFAPETVMLCVAYVASKGKRTMAAVTHELKVWRAEGVETGEQADAHLKLLALRAQREQYVSGLLGIPDSELTLGGRKAIARWYEVYGYDDAMVQEVAVQAGPSGTCGTGTASSRPGMPKVCAPSTMCAARWRRSVPAGTSGWTVPPPAETIFSRILPSPRRSTA